MTNEPDNSGATPLPLSQMQPKPKRAARKAALPVVKPEALERQAAAGVARPTVSFFTDITNRLRDNAQAEKDEIEKAWMAMRVRWLELDTLISAVDAGNAVATGNPTSSLPADLEHPGGEDAMRDLQQQLDQQRQQDMESQS